MGSRLTTLGWVLVSVVMLTVIAAVVILAQPPTEQTKTSASKNGKDGKSGAAQADPDVPAASRVYDGYDAIDFVRLTYEVYLAAIATEKTPLEGPPYDLNVQLRRLESVRPRLSASLYQALVGRYTDAAQKGGIQRDELLCGRPDISTVSTALRIGGNDNVVVGVFKESADASIGSHEATVNLRNRQIVDLAC